MNAGYKLPVPQWEGEYRVCCKCRRIDHPLYIGEADEEGKPIFDHDVIIDITFLYKRTTITKREKEQGWEFMMAEDRASKVRMICRTCLQDEADTEEVWGDFHQQKRRDAEAEQSPSFYFLLCNE